MLQYGSAFIKAAKEHVRHVGGVHAINITENLSLTLPADLNETMECMFFLSFLMLYNSNASLYNFIEESVVIWIPGKNELHSTASRQLILLDVIFMINPSASIPAAARQLQSYKVRCKSPNDMCDQEYINLYVLLV